MPLECDIINPNKLFEFEQFIKTLPPNNEIYKECQYNNAVLIRVCENTLIFTSSHGFYFERMSTDNVEDELWKYVKSKREYHCSAFSVDADDPTVIAKLRMRFQEQYGLKMARQIDDIVITHNGTTLMLVKFPSCILRFLLAPTGGLMKTAYKGEIQSLKKLPTLVHLGIMHELQDVQNDTIESVVVTEYSEAQYPIVQRMHWDIVRDVIANPNAGITLKYVGVWDA